ncbi:MAG: ATP-binding cassette domain-containing protein [Micrococcales bacterium]|nr:ATP-binding cassette domain-containing protein [Micrococcales bacterium]
MIRFNHVTFTYPEAETPTLSDVTAVVGPGELGLVVGLTGSGKTTLLRLVNGLVPHFSGGLLEGSVQVGQFDTRQTRPRDLAGVVGYVYQDPALSFVTDVVEDELAYSMEQQATSRAVMRTRVEEVIDLLGLESLRQKPLAALSAGQAQRVAMAAALTLHPQVLILDEPTSALDPATAEDVMAAISRLVQDLDLTVLMAEHRLERVVQFADLALHVSENGCVTCGDVRSVLAASDVAPPVVQLGRRLGWPSTPLSVREARRVVVAHRGRLEPEATVNSEAGEPKAGLGLPSEVQLPHQKGQSDEATGSPTPLRVKGLSVTYPGGVTGIDQIDLNLPVGQVTAVMGRNGSGKTSLLWALAGQNPPGAVRTSKPKTSLPLVALVPAQPTDLFWASNVQAEVGSKDALALLTRLAPEIDLAAHPRDLSEGQRLELALAIQLAGEAPVVALDEPTRGLDYQAKQRLVSLLKQLAAEGRTVVVASHDVEFLALVADWVVWLAGGQVIAEGLAADLLTSVPAHAPQMAKVFTPLPVLTVDQAIELGGW